MSTAKIRKSDNVLVITGKDKGKKGKVLEVLPGKGKAIVEGVNLAKKAQKPNPQLSHTGGLVEKPMPIQLSNLMLVDPKTGKPGRVGFKVDAETGEKVRVVKPSKRKVKS